MKLSISKILNYRITLVIICANLFIGFIFYSFAARLAENDFQKNIKVQIKHLSSTFSQQLWVFDLSSAEQLTDLIVEASNIKGLRLLDPKRKILIEKGVLSKDSAGYRQKELRFNGDNLVGYLELVFVKTSWEKQNFNLLIGLLGMVCITILLTIFMVSFLLNRHLTRPLNDLQQDMNRLTDGKFKSSKLASKTLEIQTIIDVFNRMTKSLAQREHQRDKVESERQELESQLHQKSKMEAIGVMAGGMAHNFNNNLSIILGYIELSKMKLPPQSEIGQFLDYAAIATMRSRDLVKQIMTYSRKNDKSQTLLQLSLLLKETISLITSTMPSSVKLQQYVSPDCIQSYIKADASQIQECLLNLCNNAVDAMEEQGRLILTLEQVDLQLKDISARFHCSPGNYLCLGVQDNGSGIPAEIQEKIFDPFFTTKELYKGTGMGLSTVQGIVEQHHGMITVESSVGQGTTFRLYFPVVDQRHREEVAVEDAKLQRGTERILIVDDDELIANLNGRMLSEMGYQVTVMTDSVEALKLFTANVHSFDLVMTDQTMPDMTGMELVQRIKLLRPQIPTILWTGYSSKVNKEEARHAGISAFLMKPTELPELSRVIKDVLKKLEFRGLESLAKEEKTT